MKKFAMGNMQSTESKRGTHGISDETEEEQCLYKYLRRIEENRKNRQKGYTPEEVHAIRGQAIKATVRYRIMYLKQF